MFHLHTIRIRVQLAASHRDIYTYLFHHYPQNTSQYHSACSNNGESFVFPHPSVPPFYTSTIFNTRRHHRRISWGKNDGQGRETNKELQDLGKYCVEEYNRKLQHTARITKLMTFSQVVEAEKQVVSGIKYYLKISATTYSGAPKLFDAVVVVKPWVDTKELLNFAPSPSTEIKQFW